MRRPDPGHIAFQGAKGNDDQRFPPDAGARGDHGRREAALLQHCERLTVRPHQNRHNPGTV